VKFSNYFFLVCPFKNGSFLLNNNKRFKSENKEGTSTTSSECVKKGKNLKYYDRYLDLGFMLQESMAKRGHNVFCV
jgi:hypothetical protein